MYNGLYSDQVQFLYFKSFDSCFRILLFFCFFHQCLPGYVNRLFTIQDINNSFIWWLSYVRDVEANIIPVFLQIKPIWRSIAILILFETSVRSIVYCVLSSITKGDPSSPLYKCFLVFSEFSMEIQYKELNLRPIYTSRIMRRHHIIFYINKKQEPRTFFRGFWEP